MNEWLMLAWLASVMLSFLFGRHMGADLVIKQLALQKKEPTSGT